MILSLNAQAMLFLSVTLAGAFIGSIYDVLRIFRKMIPHTMLFIQLEDAFYWIGTAFFLFFMLLCISYYHFYLFIL